MNLFENNKTFFRYPFVAVAIIIVVVSLVVSHIYVKDLSREERNKIEIWAEATKEMASNTDNISVNLIAHILNSNTTIPVILYDVKNNIYESTNIELPKDDEQGFLKKKSETFQNNHAPIIIEIEDFKQYIYYDDSYTLKHLQLYPYIQLGVLLIFMVTAFFALFTTMKMEQDRLWVGLSKETAHQLGTPISSLLAWLEYLKLREVDTGIIADMEKDVDRLQMITDRFSKIGSEPTLDRTDIVEFVQHSISYLEKRISKKVVFKIQSPSDSLCVDINAPLLSWVIENLTKNAVDAMNGHGAITFIISQKGEVACLEIRDTGKGIPKSKQKTIFNPGYTTKSRGWGLGLSLAKRIVEVYHQGKIYVKSSEIGVGTTFCIELKKAD